MAEDVYLTRDFYHTLLKNLENLKKERIRIAGAIDEARQQGDISENAEYDAAKEAQAHNVLQIAELEETLTSVKIIEDQNIPGDKIFIGAIVALKDMKTNKAFKYMIVSPQEANFEENKISIYSPIGKGLMGHGAGEELDIKVPVGVLKYKILKIERPK